MNLTILFSAFALTSVVVQTPALARSDASCFSTWKGSWELSAEGHPVAIYSFRSGDTGPSVIGNVQEYSGAHQTLDDVSLSGVPKTLRFASLNCVGATLVATRVVHANETSTTRLSIDSQGERWLEIADLPPGYVSPRYALRPVPARTSLPPASALPARLLFDRLGQEPVPSNDEMTRLFDADQSVRFEVERRGGWSSVSSDAEFMRKWQAADEARRARTLQILRAGQLRSGPDYYRAAFIMQHGSNSDDFLLAHHLALVALSRGTNQAGWIAAASLDRFLLSVGQPQIYGTQLGRGGAVPEEPFNKDLISVGQRRMLGVEGMASSSAGTSKP